MRVLAEKQLNQIENEVLYNAHLAGAMEVIKYKHELNAMNVFPVADGDTGTNLAITMSGIIKKTKCLSTVRDTFHSMADAALESARGNSGTIFSQYITGFSNSLPATDSVTLDEMAESIQAGVQAAYESIQNPVEGTMMTVMKDWSQTIQKKKTISDDIIAVLTEALHEALKSLNRTPSQLAVLRENGVVDSGARGFTLFLLGFMRYLQTGEQNESFLTEEDLGWGDVFEHAHSDDSSHLTYRYCTEALIEGDMIDLPKLKGELERFGDSIVAAGTNKKVKLHIHTDMPASCFRVLRKYGNLVEQKAEDMVIQHMVAHKRKYPIALITDTIADIPRTFLDEFQIHHFPLNLQVGGNTYLDRITIQADDVFQLLKEQEYDISSSQPTKKSIEGLYSFLSSYYESIIVITVSKAMSGTYSAFQKAADIFKEKDTTISVIDSKRNSAAQGLIVMKAAEAIADGLSHDEIIDVIKETIEKSSILVSVDNLKGMISSGRISKTAGAIGSIVNLKPIVSIDEDGNGILLGKAFSTKNNTKQILHMVKEIHEKDGIERYAIVHGDGTDRIKDFKSSLTSIIGHPPSYIEEVSSIVASSAGNNTIAVAFLKK